MQCMLMTDWLKMDPILSLFLYSETLQYDFTNPPIKKQSQKKKKKKKQSPSSPKALLAWWLALVRVMVCQFWAQASRGLCVCSLCLPLPLSLP